MNFLTGIGSEGVLIPSGVIIRGKSYYSISITNVLEFSMDFKPTDQQKDIFNYVNNVGGTLLIEASAGCAKTSTAVQIVKDMNPRKGLYTAFNKSIVEDSMGKLSEYNMECKTLHALAYRYVQPNEVRELSYNDIKEDLKYRDKADVLEAINTFFVSSSTNMGEYFEEYFKDYDTDLAPVAEKYVMYMLEEEIPMSFGFMLKYFHLMLHEGAKCGYDIVILDEINDTTAVSLEIFKLLQSPVKLGLGERHQAIYHFMNLSCGFTELKGSKLLPLTKSFRCSTVIAKRIEAYMQTSLDENFEFIGTDGPTKNTGTLFVTRTNSTIVGLINDSLQNGLGFKLLRNISEIFACPLAISSASAGKKVYQHKYKFLEKEYANYMKERTKHKSFHTYLEDVVGDEEISSGVTLLASLRGQNINIFSLYNKAKNAKTDPDRVISTAFTCKGLEMKTVIISDDLNRMLTKVFDGDGDGGEQDIADKRLYYVACSRAIKNLHNAVHLPEIEDL